MMNKYENYREQVLNFAFYKQKKGFHSAHEKQLQKNLQQGIKISNNR